MNHKTIYKDIEGCLDYYKEHILVPLVDDPEAKIRGWYVKLPNSRMQSFLVLAHPEGVSIHGDMAPGAGMGSCVGAGLYSLNWFVGRLGISYLCEKFLRPEYCEFRAREHIDDLIKEYEEELKELEEAHAETEEAVAAPLNTSERSLPYMMGWRSQKQDRRESLKEFTENLKDARDSCEFSSDIGYVRSFEELLEGHGLDSESMYPSSDYLHHDAVKLGVIQRVFSRLYHEKYTPKEEALLESK